MGKPDVPVTRAAVICDHAIREDSGKIALIGIFSQVVAEVLPTVLAPICLYLAVTNIRKEADLSVQLLGPSDDNVVEKLAELRGKLTAVNPLVVAELVLKFPLPLKREGYHRIVVSSGGEHVGETSFIVTRRLGQ